MRKVLICVVGLSLLLGASALFAQAPTGAAAPAPATGTTGATTGTGHGHGHGMAAGAKRAGGVVVSVEPACASFVVKPKKGDNWTFSTDDKTTYWVGRKKGKCEDLKVDSHVNVTYHVDGDKKVAHTVRIVVAKADAMSKTTGAKTTGTGSKATG